MKRSLTTLLLALATGLALFGGTGAANAASSGNATQQKIESILAEHPGGVQTGKDSIAWKNGAVTMRLDAGVTDCGAGQFCLWENNYSGKFVSFNQGLCAYQFLSIDLKVYAFNDAASSWANNTPYFVDVWDNYGSSAGRWTMLPFSGSSQIDRDYNDKASSLSCHA